MLNRVNVMKGIFGYKCKSADRGLCKYVITRVYKKKTCIEKMQEEKRNAAGGAENIWFYSEQLGKSYNVLL